VIDGLNTVPAPLYAVSVGVSHSGSSGGGTGGGGAAGKANFQDFAVTKPLDELSPKLMVACATGKHFQKATIEVFGEAGPGSPPILTWELADVLVSSLSFGAGGDTPTDNVTLSFSKVCSIYAGLDSGGKLAEVKECFDLGTGKQL
jgi:type VI secretion system secreted protein Hcp